MDNCVFFASVFLPERRSKQTDKFLHIAQRLTRHHMKNQSLYIFALILCVTYLALCAYKIQPSYPSVKTLTKTYYATFVQR